MSHPGSSHPLPSQLPQQHPTQEELLRQAQRLARRYRACGISVEDLQQEACLVALEAGLTFGPGRHPCLIDHLVHVMRSHLHALCRREQRRAMKRLPANIPDPHDAIEEAERKDFWEVARQALSPTGHTVLRMLSLGHGYDEIADHLGVSEAHVRQIKRRALKQLQG